MGLCLVLANGDRVMALDVRLGQERQHCRKRSDRQQFGELVVYRRSQGQWVGSVQECAGPSGQVGTPMVIRVC